MLLIVSEYWLLFVVFFYFFLFLLILHVLHCSNAWLGVHIRLSGLPAVSSSGTAIIMNSNLLHCGGANLPAEMGGSRRRLLYVAWQRYTQEGLLKEESHANSPWNLWQLNQKGKGQSNRRLLRSILLYRLSCIDGLVPDSDSFVALQVLGESHPRWLSRRQTTPQIGSIRNYCNVSAMLAMLEFTNTLSHELHATVPPGHFQIGHTGSDDAVFSEVAWFWCFSSTPGHRFLFVRSCWRWRLKQRSLGTALTIERVECRVMLRGCLWLGLCWVIWVSVLHSDLPDFPYMLNTKHV